MAVPNNNHNNRPDVMRISYICNSGPETSTTPKTVPAVNNNITLPPISSLFPEAYFGCNLCRLRKTQRVHPGGDCQECSLTTLDVTNRQCRAPCYAIVSDAQHLVSGDWNSCRRCYKDGPICRCGAFWVDHVGQTMWQCSSKHRCRGARFYHDKCLNKAEKIPRCSTNSIVCKECFLAKDDIKAELAKDEARRQRRAMQAAEVDDANQSSDRKDNMHVKEAEGGDGGPQPAMGNNVEGERSGTEESGTLVGDGEPLLAMNGPTLQWRLP